MDETRSENPNSAASEAPASCDVVIVGAGPYGLAAASHLRKSDRLDVRIFGSPMSFWGGMPKGMLLRSRWEASHIGHPSGPLTLDVYKAEKHRSFGAPIPLEHFVEYGRWVQEHVAPDVDTRRVASVARQNGGFTVTLEDGSVLHAGRVVVAAGIEPFARRPAEFEGLGRSVTHSSEWDDFAPLAGKNVAVVGGGQSALESAALLHEAGARAEVIARRPSLNWLKGGVIQRKLGPFKPVFYAPTDVGPIGMSRLLAAPRAFRLFPRRAQDTMARRAIRPAGAKWLRSRLVDVPLTLGRSVVSASNGNGVDLQLDDGSSRHVDHVVLGTGYQVDVAGYDFLDRALVDEIVTVNGYPVLRRGLESSVPGLHFLGAPAAWSFGPLMRFVSGTWWSGRSLARAVRP
jgi:NADPH-dependent 2,4-dienoyl-CoA reductase/sulfur reductase-like enzyme